MKKLLKPVIRFLVTTGVTWKTINLFIKITHRFKFEKDLIEIEKGREVQQNKEKRIKEKFADLTVRHGFFKGMTYFPYESHGSSLYPKLLGSYESELSEIIEQICKTNYSEIIDVGCAEGFYAVGFARRMFEVIVYAYDNDPLALTEAKRMAELNKVANRVVFNSFCSASTLSEFKFTGKSLIFCDCEGYEIELFNSSNISNLLKTDILIELHDGKNERISPYLFKLFEKTHNHKLIQSVNCFTKASEYFELKDLTDDELEICLQERGGIQQWVFFTSKIELK